MNISNCNLAGMLRVLAMWLALPLSLSVLCGLTATVFTFLTHGLKDVMARCIAWPPARPLLGGFAVIALTFAFGTRIYNGLSEGLIELSLFGGDVPTWAFASDRPQV